jgi:glycerol-3-phosphate acyltransferase PlsY
MMKDWITQSWILWLSAGLIGYLLGSVSFAMAGHNYPLYHKLRGGSGLSPLIGALLIINWYGFIISSIAAIILGYLTGAVLVMRWAWMAILILWFIFFIQDPWHVGYMAASTLLFLFTLRKELATAIKIGRNRKSTQEEVSEFMLMGKGLGRFIDRYGLPALIRGAGSRDKETKVKNR